MILNLELHPAGFIQKAHGTNGAVVIRTEESFKNTLSEGNWLFLNIRKKPVPFFIASAKPYSHNDYILKLDGIDSVEAADSFSGTEISVEMKAGEKKEEAIDMYAFKGFSITDTTTDKDLGKIAEVLNTSASFYFELEDGTLIPAHFDLVENVNYRTRTLIMNLPEGLLDLN